MATRKSRKKTSRKRKRRSPKRPALGISLLKAVCGLAILLALVAAAGMLVHHFIQHRPQTARLVSPPPPDPVPPTSPPRPDEKAPQQSPAPFPPRSPSSSMTSATTAAWRKNCSRSIRL